MADGQGTDKAEGLLGYGITYQPPQSGGSVTKNNAIGKRHFTQSVDIMLLTLFPMGYLKGFSSSHTQMKTTRENTLLVYSTSILEVVNVYTMKS